jgi:hypothetical protein
VRRAEVARRRARVAVRNLHAARVQVARASAAAASTA